MRKLRSRLTYANVMATIAVFIALGGTGLAASQLGKNSVGPKQLRKEAVTTSKIKNRAVTGKKIRPETFGTVPSAADANTLDGLSANQITQGSKLRCPDGTELFGGVCFETATRPEAKWFKAFESCASAGRSLPIDGDLAAYLIAKLDEPEANWSGSLSFDNAEYIASLVSKGEDDKVNIALVSTFTYDFPYRCVTHPTN